MACPRLVALAAFSPFSPVSGILGVAVQRRQHLLVTVGELYAFDDHVPPMLRRQAVRDPQPERQRAVIGHGGHAQLAAGRLITVAQHEEIVATGIPPVGQPLLVALVAIGLQVVLPAPEFLGPKAQSHSSRVGIVLQRNQPQPQIGEPPPFLMNLIPSPTLGSTSDLPLSTSNSPMLSAADIEPVVAKDYVPPWARGDF